MAKPNSLRHCKGCPLCGNPKVWSDGDPASPVYFVGRNPGRVEVESGIPFTGRAGGRLDKVLADLEVNRGSVYITNLVKCWTPNDDEPPTEAVEHCWPYLKVELVGVVDTFAGFVKRNAIVVALGKQCQKFLTEKEVSYFPMIHPAAALRKGQHEAVLRRDTRLLKKALEEVCHVEKERAMDGKPSKRNSKRESSS